MSVVGWVIAIIFLAGVAVAGCIAVVNDEDTLGRIVLIDHEYGGDDYGSDGNTGYDGEGGRSGDMEQGDGRNCRNFCDNVITVPAPGDDDEREMQ